MAAYLQWRRFVFFDRETVKEPSGLDGAGGKPFAVPPGIAVCDSGRGSLVFGDILRGAGSGSLRPARGCSGRACGGFVRSAVPPPLNIKVPLKCFGALGWPSGSAFTGALASSRH